MEDVHFVANHRYDAKLFYFIAEDSGFVKQKKVTSSSFYNGLDSLLNDCILHQAGSSFAKRNLVIELCFSFPELVFSQSEIWTVFPARHRADIPFPEKNFDTLFSPVLSSIL